MARTGNEITSSFRTAHASTTGSRSPRPRPHINHRRWLKVCAIVAAALVVTAILLARYLLYSEGKITGSLRETPSTAIKVEHFKPIYFPHPGCIVEGLSVRSNSNDPDSPPLITVRKLTIQGSYADLFLRPHHIARLILDGLRVQIPERARGMLGGGGSFTSKITIGTLIANGALLEIARAHGRPPLRFDIHELSMESVGAKQAFSYKLDMQNAEPPGEIVASGHFGPFNTQDPAKTPLSGAYSFDRADLSAFKGISGILSSSGNFSGSLANIDAQGTTDSPDFEVVRSGHTGNLSSIFSVTVDGTNGNVALNWVDALYLKTKISARGSVAHKEGYHGKFTTLDFAVNGGRIQDMLRLFVQEPKPPMSGVTSLQAHVTVPPEGKPFLKEVTLDGDFGIRDGQFEDPQTQAKADGLSLAARGDKKAHQIQQQNPNVPQENVVSDLRGHVSLRGGVATFTNVSYKVPSADAQMNGTYNLLNEAVNFHGKLKMDAKLSKSSSGIKSLFAKVIDPFVDKKHGSLVPVVMNGTYDNPHFGLDLNPAN